MVIPAVKAFLLLSLFTFLGTHARNLPDILKISKTDHGLTSSITSITRPARRSPPPPQVRPPTHPILSVSDQVTENKPEEVIRMPSFIGNHHKPPPPAPYLAPPQVQANAYHEWRSIFANTGKALDPSELRSFSYVREITEDGEIIKRPYLHSPPPPHLAPPHVQMKICEDDEIIKRPYLHSPPPPHLAPPHVQMEIWATE
ncbi:hypothetical protein ACET3Z_017087 [Daucus carota]